MVPVAKEEGRSLITEGLLQSMEDEGERREAMATGEAGMKKERGRGRRKRAQNEDDKERAEEESKAENRI